MCFFTFNMVSPHQAVLFGGYHQGGDMSDVYLFNFEVMVSVVRHRNASLF